jgi:N12 class adenine-specific DNA methylase
VVNTKYYFVTYETRDGEHEYRELGVLQARDYKIALEKAVKAKPLYNRYGWEEFCRHDEIMEITGIEYAVLKKFVLNIDYYFNENGKLRI